jgi:hypothetical protein
LYQVKVHLRTLPSHICSASREYPGLANPPNRNLKSSRYIASHRSARIVTSDYCGRPPRRALLHVLCPIKVLFTLITLGGHQLLNSSAACQPAMLTSFRPVLRSRIAKVSLFPSLIFAARYASTMKPRFSPGSDELLMTHALEMLLTTEGGRWSLIADGEALERSFKFKTFAKTWVCSIPLH